MTYPAAWGAHRLAGVRRALAAHCQGPVQLMPEPEAAAWGSAQPAQRGQLWALYDLGETSLDTAVLRREEGGWTILSTATRPVPVGGIDIDDAVLGHLLSAAPTSTVLPRASLATLRLTSADVKEALSTDTEVALPTRLEPASPTVRLTRGEFETMIQGLLNQTVLALRETIDDGGVTVEDLSAVLLAGGSARIPLVAQHVSAVLDVPVGASSDPGTMIAMGAARSGVAQEGSRPSTPGASTDEQSAPEGDTALSQDELSPDGPSVLLPFVHPDQRRLATHAWRLVVAALVVASAAYLVWGFTSDSSGLFGLAPHGGPALELLGGR